MALRTGMRWRVVTTSAIALALTASAMAVALVAASGIRAESRELSQRLVPAAAAAVDLLEEYQAQQNWLRGYVTAGRPGALSAFDDDIARARADQDQIARLARGYPAVSRRLAATVAAYQSWRTDVAGPELGDMARGDAADARALQAETGRIRPYVLAIRSAGSALQETITGEQRDVTARLDGQQGTLLAALIVMCVVITAMVGDALASVWLGLLRPFRALRRAMASVTAGDYETRIPAAGPAELANLGRGIELMRLRLVATLDNLQQAEQRFRRVFDAAPDAMIAVAADGSIRMANAQAVQLFGYPAGMLIGQPVEMLVPEDARAEMATQRAAYFADPPSQAIDAALRMSGQRRDGRRFPAEITLNNLPVDSGVLVTAAIRDVTERLAMEAERERLRAIAERERAIAEQERVERRLQQSQRLESLGQLIGGVAHDFNNLLNVIQGYADSTAEEIRRRAEADPQLAPVLEDIGQVQAAAQQAARLTSQLLTFSRHEVRRPEVIDLNEAVRQAGQLLRCTLGEHSDLAIEPVTDEDAAPEATPTPGGDSQRGHGETILLVEDEASLRELTSRILARSGYQVCVVASGSEAVRRASDPDQPIDLLLTDVIMPEMLGNEVAARVGEIRPGVPALFMSGYAQPILDTHGIPSPHYDILEKPFTEAALLTRVRRALTRSA